MKNIRLFRIQYTTDIPLSRLVPDFATAFSPHMNLLTFFYFMRMLREQHTDSVYRGRSIFLGGKKSRLHEGQKKKLPSFSTTIGRSVITPNWQKKSS